MQKLIVFISVVMIFSLLVLQGFSPTYEMPKYVSPNVDSSTGVSPEKALNEIYFNISTVGIKTADMEKLQKDFFVSMENVQSAWGRYTDGRFGINDIIILLPKSGEQDSVVSVLENIKLARMEHFSNFDIYNAYNIASNGKIVWIGNYAVLLMLEDNESAISALEKLLI